MGFQLFIIAILLGSLGDPLNSTFDDRPTRSLVSGFVQPIISSDRNNILSADDAVTSCPATTVSSQECGQWRRRFLEGIEASKLDSYHLIWSPGALRKVASGMAVLGLSRVLYPIVFSQKQNPLQLLWIWLQQTKIASPIAAVTSNFVVPLLASACCLLQLGINLLAGGCAGFNTVLGPLRPYFLSLLLFMTFTSARWTSLRWYGLTLVRWSVALLPEALQLWNHVVFSSADTPPGGNNRHSLVMSQQVDVTTLTPFHATARLDIPTMGCVACINKIQTAVRKDARVVEVNAALNPLGAKGGYATLKVATATRDEVDELVEAVVSAVEDAGFDPCYLEQLEISSQ